MACLSNAADQPAIEWPRIRSPDDCLVEMTGPPIAPPEGW